MITAIRYKTILADPPWGYRNTRNNGAAAKHYPTMATPEICALRVPDIVADDAVLFMWATWPCLPDAMQVISAWGFRYMTGFPWVKILKDTGNELPGIGGIRPVMGTGFWVRACSEMVLICKRGKAKPPVSPMLGLLGECLEHSRKPDSIYQLCEQHPGPYLELFARRERFGWDAFGNQIGGSITLE